MVDDLSDVEWNEEGASGSSKRLGAMFGGRNKLFCLRCRDRGADVVHVDPRVWLKADEVKEMGLKGVK